MQHLQYWRRQSGLTQAELAEKAGVHTNSIIRWEKGYRVPSPADVQKLCQALNITGEMLVRGPTGIDFNLQALGHGLDRFYFGYKGDGSIVINGTVPQDVDPDQFAQRIRAELIAARAAKQARDATLSLEFGLAAGAAEEVTNDASGPGNDHDQGQGATTPA